LRFIIPDPDFLFLKVKELKEVFQGGALFSRRRFGAKTASLETILSNQFIFFLGVKKKMNIQQKSKKKTMSMNINKNSSGTIRRSGREAGKAGKG